MVLNFIKLKADRTYVIIEFNKYCLWNGLCAPYVVNAYIIIFILCCYQASGVRFDAIKIPQLRKIHLKSFNRNYQYSKGYDEYTINSISVVSIQL